MRRNRVRASHVLSTSDLKMRTEQDVTEIVSRFLVTAEGVAAHWVEYGKGVLLFVMAPGDGRSGAFYIYDRQRGSFWLLELADGVFGGYSRREMRRKIRDFRLLDFAQNPARLYRHGMHESPSPTNRSCGKGERDSIAPYESESRTTRVYSSRSAQSGSVPAARRAGR